MSHGHDLPETCQFGHVIQAHSYEGSPIPGKLKGKLESGEISTLDELEASEWGFYDLLGERYKKLKVRAGSQGIPRAAALDAADRFDDDLGYDVAKTEEKIFVSPQSNLHGEYMQRKQQSEQNVRETMRNISQLTKQKHMLEHDVRKLRQRAESLRQGDEVNIKGDFIELVDGAGGAGQQGGDEASLKFYRDQNIYPSIVADFNEMDSLDDLKDDGKLSNLPNNEKAILRKKYSMYEKWKDLYGSEIQRKLNELKQQLRSIERSIEETKQWLKPYVRDAVMINEKNEGDLQADINRYMTFRGTSSQFRELEFICSKPLKNTGEAVEMADSREEATHYRVVVVKTVHVNLAGFDQPQSPAQGPSAAVIMVYPVIVCKHIFEKIFEKRKQRKQDHFKQILDDYTGDFERTDTKLQELREEKDLSIRELRNKVSEELDGQIDIEFSATVRRIEDGFDPVHEIEKRHGEDVLEALDKVLDGKLLEDEEEEDKDMFTGIEKTLRLFTGQVDPFYLQDGVDPFGDLTNEVRRDYYWELKLGFDLYTMK